MRYSCPAPQQKPKYLKMHRLLGVDRTRAKALLPFSIPNHGEIHSAFFASIHA
jgi:hypothetical protein